MLRAHFPPSLPEVFRVINAIARVPPPKNEPTLSYAPGTPERAELQATLKRMAGEQVEIPLLIGGIIASFLGTGDIFELNILGFIVAVIAAFLLIGVAEAGAGRNKR